VLEVLGDGARADADGAGDRLVGAALSRQPEDLELAVGEAGQAVRAGRRHGDMSAVPAARAPHRVAQRSRDGAQHVAIGVREVPLCPVERDGDDLAIPCGGQGEGDLVLDRNVAVELRVEAQVVEFPVAEEIADLGRLIGTGSTVVGKHRVLVQVRLEHDEAGRVKAARRVIGVIGQLIRPGPDLVVRHDIAADQVSQPGQDQVGRPGKQLKIGHAVEELHCPTQRLQRNVHARHPPRDVCTRSVRNVRIDTSVIRAV
jgi:hypothetical protein